MASRGYASAAETVAVITFKAERKNSERYIFSMANLKYSIGLIFLKKYYNSPINRYHRKSQTTKNLVVKSATEITNFKIPFKYAQKYATIYFELIILINAFRMRNSFFVAYFKKLVYKISNP